MLSKILIYTMNLYHENESSMKVMFFFVFFMDFSLKEFCKQFNIHLLITSQRPKPPVSAIETQINDNGLKILLAWLAHKW